MILVTEHVHHALPRHGGGRADHDALIIDSDAPAEGGLAGFIEKPFTADDLAQKLQAALGPRT